MGYGVLHVISQHIQYMLQTVPFEDIFEFLQSIVADLHISSRVGCNSDVHQLKKYHEIPIHVCIGRHADPLLYGIIYPSSL
jgi:hypothetical protein